MFWNQEYYSSRLQKKLHKQYCISLVIDILDEEDCTHYRGIYRRDKFYERNE